MTDRLSVTALIDKGTEERELFMSFGLLNEFCSVIGHPDRLSLLGVDPDLTASLITIAMVPRRPNGRPSVDLNNYDIPGVSVEDAEKIIAWVGDAALSFFVRCAETSVKRLGDNQSRMAALKSSLPGSATSP